MGFMEVMNENDFFAGVGHKNLVVAEDKDQAHLIGRIKGQKYGESFFFDEERDFSDVMNEIMQPSLFGGKKVMIVLECSSYTDKQWEEILEQPDAMCFFFKKSATKGLIDRFKKCGKVLRLAAEKPWDRKNRLVKEVVYAISKNGSQISQPTAYRFVERVFSDLQLFHQELDKLKSYTQGFPKVEDHHIDAVVKPLPEENLFKVSEDLVWKTKNPENFTLDSVSTLLQLIGSLRFQAYMGLKITSRDDIKLAPWQEKKYRQKAHALGDTYFKKLLRLIYKAEQRAKGSTITPASTFDILSLEILALGSPTSARV